MRYLKLKVNKHYPFCYRISHESLHGSGSQGSMAMDLHLECPVTLRIQDQRRNPLRRQRRVVDEEERHVQEDSSRRSSHSCSPRLQACQTREAVQPIAGRYTYLKRLRKDDDIL